MSIQRFGKLQFASLVLVLALSPLNSQAFCLLKAGTALNRNWVFQVPFVTDQEKAEMGPVWTNLTTQIRAFESIPSTLFFEARFEPSSDSELPRPSLDSAQALDQDRAQILARIRELTRGRFPQLNWGRANFVRDFEDPVLEGRLLIVLMRLYQYEGNRNLGTRKIRKLGSLQTRLREVENTVLKESASGRQDAQELALLFQDHFPACSH